MRSAQANFFAACDERRAELAPETCENARAGSAGDAAQSQSELLAAAPPAIEHAALPVKVCERNPVDYLDFDRLFINFPKGVVITRKEICYEL